VNRALFHSQERGQPEKFRPYGLPSDEWLAWVKARLRERVSEVLVVAVEFGTPLAHPERNGRWGAVRQRPLSSRLHQGPVAGTGPSIRSISALDLAIVAA